jgi:hypothetical protein
MKARLLKKLLGETKYIINNNEDYIAVGSPLCHNLISVDKKTLKIKYAIDTWNEGRSSLPNHDELRFIWDKLQEIIDNGQIKDIIEGQDEIENPLPVFTVRDGKLVKSFTDCYGWPNITIDGDLMYDNTWFKTELQAINYGIGEYQYGIKSLQNSIDEKRKELKWFEERRSIYSLFVFELEELKKKYFT